MRKLRKDPEMSGDLEFANVHDNLKSIRTKFDNIKSKRVDLENKCSKLTEEVQKYKKAE